VLLTVLWFRGSDLTGPDGAATALLVLLLSVAAAFLLHTAVEVPAQRRLAGRRAPSHAGTELPVQRVGPKPPTGVLLRSPADGAARPEDPPTVAGG
jgi:peptidoglycan/LPS O-acetylase OafA/YrhL